MSFLAYVAHQWEYLLSLLLAAVAAWCAWWSFSHGAEGISGLCVLSGLGLLWDALQFADAGDFRQAMAEAARREKRAQDLDG